jgi:hypothetical protein
MGTVVKYFTAWMDQWPTVHDLARADIEVYYLVGCAWVVGHQSNMGWSGILFPRVTLAKGRTGDC